MALTKVKLIADSIISDVHIGTLTTDALTEGDKLFYTDARVSSYLAANNFATTGAGYFYNATLSANILTFDKSDGTTDSVDLSLYLDDTNLARLVSGTLDALTGIATFTRDDSSTFTIDFSAFLSDANDYVSSGSFNTTTGVLTLTRLGGGTVTVDLDGKYAEASHTHLWAHITDRPTALSAFTNDLGNYGGFLTSFTETDPVYVASSWYTTTNNSSNWNTAYDWGNHANAGYQAASTAITTSNISSQSVNYAVNSTKLYASDAPYTINGANPYYMYMNYDGGSYWELKVSPATPGTVRVAYSNSSGNADTVDGLHASSFASASHTHDDRYYTESEADSRFINASGDTMSGTLTLSSISGTDQTVENTYGAYLHLGAWGVGRTDAAAVLVNTAYRADYAESLFDMNISRFTNNSGYITASASITGSSGSVSGLTLTNSSNGINPDNVTQNQIGYNTSVSLFGQTDGGLYSSAYSSSWIHQIYGDFRTGQIAVRGKNSGTWQAWRTVIDSGNIGSQSVNYATSAGSATTSSTTTHYASRTDGTWYNVVWAAGNPSHLYSADSVQINSSAGAIRANIFYDNNNTGYYVDPASISVMATVSAGTLNGTDVYTTGGWFRNHTNSNGIYWNQTSWHLYPKNTSDFYLRSGASDASIQFMRAGTAASYIHNSSDNDIGFLTTARSWSLRVDDSGNSFATSSSRAPIFYDSNDTSYYVNPNGNSRLYSVDSPQGYVSNGNPWGTSNSAFFPNGITTAGGTNWIYGFTYIGNAPGNGAGHEFYTSGSSYSTGNMEANGSMRAPIFYDRNDTSYYIDGASESQLAKLKLIDATSGYDLMLGPYTLSRTYNDSARHGIVINSDLYPHIDLNATTSSDSNVTHGATISMTGKLGAGFRRWGMGISQYNPNELSFGYYDNQANPHYGVGINWSYPAKMWIDTAGDLYSTGSMRSPIFYDSNNTGYYVNPASQSNVDDFRAAAYRGNANVGGTGTATWHPDGIYVGSTQWLYGTQYRNGATTSGQGWLYIDTNYGQSVVGLYASTRYQGVWAMGDSYKLPADGTSIGNLYGMAWSHPNAGGVAGNLNTHGLLVTENGSFLAAVSGSIRSRDDMRAPIFYDSNNTGYYCDPNSLSRFDRVDPNEIYNYGWFRSHTSGNGVYNQATGQHFYSDSGSYWNMGGGNFNGQGIRFRDNHNSTIRGYVYYDQSNNVGFLNQDGSWRLRVTGGDYVQTDGSSMRAPMFYDSNDTSRYLDPNSTSVLSRLEMYKNNVGSAISDTCLYIDNASGSNGTTYNMMSDVSTYFGSRHIGFLYNGTVAGYISAQSTTSVAYSTTSSDLRLKKNIEPWVENTLEKFEDIEPKLFNFNFQEDGEDKDRGFIAQDMVDKFPEAYLHDFSMDEGRSGYYSFNPSGMVIYLIKALKEQTEINKSLISRIESLENK